MKINALDCSKSYQENDFSAKIIMENRDTFRIILLITSTYILKNPKVKPVFKKSCRIDKETCRPISILPIVSKIYERLIIIRSSHHRCSVKKVFLDFHKIHRKTPLLLQRDSDTGVFLWILQNFKETLFYRTIQGDCLYIINFQTQPPEVFYEKRCS